MEPIDLELKNALSRTEPIPAAELAALNSRILQSYARKQRGVSRLTGLYLLVMAAALVALLALLRATPDLKRCLEYGILIVILFEGTVLMKLWFWIMHSKIATVREIKMLQLALAEMKGQSAPAQPGTASATPPTAAPGQLPPAPAPASKPLVRAVLGSVWLLAVAALIYTATGQNPYQPHDVTPYFEKTVSPEAATAGTEWEETFEVTRARQHFYPRVVPGGKSVRLWLSVGAEGRQSMFTGRLTPDDRISFGISAPGRYTVRAKAEEADRGYTLRIGGVDQIPGTPMFARLLLLMASAALTVAIPLVWLQGRWLRGIDPELGN